MIFYITPPKKIGVLYHFYHFFIFIPYIFLKKLIPNIKLLISQWKIPNWICIKLKKVEL
ncbi:MAG: hypothetical protein RLZZ231_499 [Bacteroidota bacterium]